MKWVVTDCSPTTADLGGQPHRQARWHRSASLEFRMKGGHMNIRGAAFSIAVAIASISSAAAQDAYKWADIDCKESRLVPLASTKCRATNLVS
jgi:hypothetical protein